MLQYIAYIAEFLSNLMKLGKWNAVAMISVLISIGGSVVYGKIYVDDLVGGVDKQANLRLDKLEKDTILIFGELKAMNATLVPISKDLSDTKANQAVATKALLDMQKIVMDIYKDQQSERNN